MTKIDFTDQELIDLAKLLDVALKTLGLPAVLAVAEFVKKIDAAKQAEASSAPHPTKQQTLQGTFMPDGG